MAFAASALVAACGGATKEGELSADAGPPPSPAEVLATGDAAVHDDGHDADGDGGLRAPSVPSSETATEPLPLPTASNDVDAGTARPDGIVIEETDVTLTETGDAIECERQIEFGAVELSSPEPFDVVIVADHSESLSWSRDELASGLSDLLQEVQGRDVRFFVLTPTQYGAASASTSMAGGGDLVKWRDPVSLEPYTNEMTTYSQTCSDVDFVPMECPEYPPPLDVPFHLEGKFELRMPEPVAKVTREMTSEQVQAQQLAVADKILGLGLGGAPYEQPLCTLLRYVGQDRAQLPERAVFVVISDEDDDTDPLDCLSGVSFETHYSGTVTTPCDEDCDFVAYQVSVPAVAVVTSFTCMPHDDFGNPLPDGAYSLNAYGPAMASCEGVNNGACSEQQLADVEPFCSAGDRIANCDANCQQLEQPTTCTVDVADTSIDACVSSFSSNGIKYENVADYCERTRGLEGWAGCTGAGYDNQPGMGSLQGSQIPQRIVWGLEATDMVTAFRQTASEVFGQENHFVEVIGFMPEFSCEPGPGQSYATHLATLATSADDVFPICESYAPALGRIQNYASSLLQTEYHFELGARETLEAVFVTDLTGTERELAVSDYDYTFESSTLTLHRDAITSRDRSLRVELEIHCTAVIR